MPRLTFEEAFARIITHTTVEDYEAAFGAATTKQQIGLVLREAQRARHMLGPVETASDPNSNRRRIVRALNEANERLHGCSL